jgi:hypothetical protein
MMARFWSAQAMPAQAPAYADHLRPHVLPTLRKADGYAGAPPRPTRRGHCSGWHFLLGARHNLPGLLRCAKPTSVWEEDTMTELLHLGDSYLREFHASVVVQSNQAVRLDRTVFYPGGAGQPPDVGWLRWLGGETRVVDMKEEGDMVWHVLEGPVPPVGQDVHGALDWERRYAIMCYHSALHVVVGAVYHLYKVV